MWWLIVWYVVWFVVICVVYYCGNVGVFVGLFVKRYGIIGCVEYVGDGWGWLYVGYGI